MARGVNKAIILGNLGDDPTIRHTQNDTVVANLSVATSEQWKDKHTGERRENTEWHRVSAFGKLAEIMRDYLGKGSKVYIEGRIQTRKWQDRDGNDRYTTEIVANDMQMLDSRPSGQQPANNQPTPGYGQPQQPPPAGPTEDDLADDIPF